VHEAMQHNRDPLLGGFYTVGEAARLLRIENRRGIRRWLQRGDGSPVIERDYEPLNGSQELSFWDLIEVRFVEHFRSQGLSLQFLRKVAAKARTEFRTRHPFALSKARFLTDRKRIFQQTAEAEGDRRTHDILSGQYEMYEALEDVLSKGVAFDPETELARAWQPLRNDCPHVVIDPRFAYGHPVVGTNRVPTAALFRQWRAENGDRERVADWFEVSRDDLDEAIEFELRLVA